MARPGRAASRTPSAAHSGTPWQPPTLRRELERDHRPNAVGRKSSTWPHFSQAHISSFSPPVNNSPKVGERLFDEGD
jgi:hypothetical protein